MKKIFYTFVFVFMLGLLIASYLNDESQNPQVFGVSLKQSMSTDEDVFEYLTKGRSIDFSIADKEAYKDADTATILKHFGGVQEIDGGLWFNTSIGVPICNESTRGLLWFSASENGSPDAWLGCMKDEKDNYIWQTIR